ncbi:MAG: FUSC family protein [Spirulina sp. SIO3F2]|nr:FUSC family protein [Spirulina sp. SIO3F2]
MTGVDFDSLLRISVLSTESNFNQENFKFTNADQVSIISDNVQYIANRILSEIMKKDFQNHYSSVVSEFDGALDPDMSIYNLLGVSDVHTQYGELINLMSPIYVAQLLQTHYYERSGASWDGLENVNKKALNSWDLIKANNIYANAEDSEQFRNMSAAIYNIAIDHSNDVVYTSSGDFLPGSNLKEYKESNPAQHWGKQLFDHYQNEETMIAVQERIFELDDDASLAVRGIQSIFSKLRCLQFTDNEVNTEDIDNLENNYFGLLLLSLADHVKCGSDESSSLKNNTQLQRQVFEQLIHSENQSDTRQFWLEIEEDYGIDFFMRLLMDAISKDEAESQLTGENVKEAVRKAFPEFKPNAGKVSSVVSEAALSQILMFLALGHLCYSTFEDENPDINIPELIGFASAAYDAGKGVLYVTLTRQLRSYFLGLVDDVAVNGGKTFKQAATFYLNYARGLRSVRKAEKEIVEAVFMRSSVAKIAERVGVVLGIFALGASAYVLWQAILSGYPIDIIFEAINTSLALASVTLGIMALAGISWAGPVGLAVAIIGAIVAVVQWLIELLIPRPAPPTPIQIFTNNVIIPLGYEYNSNRYCFALKQENATGYYKIFMFYEKELLFEPGGHAQITIPGFVNAGAVCTEGDNLYVYHHETPKKTNIALTASVDDLYHPWDSSLSVISVVVLDGYSYGLIKVGDIPGEKKIFKWRTGVNPPQDSETVNVDGYDDWDGIEAICKIGNRIFALSNTRVYEFNSVVFTEVCEYRYPAENALETINIFVDSEGLIYSSVFFKKDDYSGNSFFQIEIIDDEFSVQEFDLETISKGDRFTSVTSGGNSDRKNFIHCTSSFISRTGLLTQVEGSDEQGYLEVVSGVRFQDGDLSWNSSAVLPNAEWQNG